MVEVECLVCKKSLDIPAYFNLDDCDVQLYCHECNLLWNVRFKSSKVTKYKLAEKNLNIQPRDIVMKTPIPDYDESLRLVKPDAKELKEN